MSGPIKDGGTAFPMQDPQAIHAYAIGKLEGVSGTDERDRIYMTARSQAIGGMTLRDYFAAHEPLDPNESIGKALAEKLTGRRLPDFGSDEFLGQHEFALAAALFWADAEAAYRYLRADAMLRAREGGAA